MFCSTMFASLVANAVSNPFDVVKSRVQNMPKPLPGQAAMYTSMTDCFTKTIAKEGIGALYQACARTRVRTHAQSNRGCARFTSDLTYIVHLVLTS